MTEEQIKTYFLAQLATSGDIETPANPARLKQSLALAADFVKAMARKEKQIEDDIQAQLAELQADEEEGKDLIFSFTFGGKINLDKSLITAEFGFTAKRREKFAHDLRAEDEKANQPILPGIE